MANVELLNGPIYCLGDVIEANILLKGDCCLSSGTYNGPHTIKISLPNETKGLKENITHNLELCGNTIPVDVPTYLIVDSDHNNSYTVHNATISAPDIIVNHAEPLPGSDIIWGEGESNFGIACDLIGPKEGEHVGYANLGFNYQTTPPSVVAQSELDCVYTVTVAISGVTITVSATIDLPVWPSYAEASAEDKAHFDNFKDRVEIHEIGHVQVANRFADYIPSQVIGLAVTATGDSYEEAQQTALAKLSEARAQLFNQLWDEHASWHDQYHDEASHSIPCFE